MLLILVNGPFKGREVSIASDLKEFVAVVPQAEHAWIKEGQGYLTRQEIVYKVTLVDKEQQIAVGITGAS